MKTYAEVSDRVLDVSENSSIVIEFISMMDGDGSGTIDPMERKNVAHYQFYISLMSVLQLLMNYSIWIWI